MMQKSIFLLMAVLLISMQTTHGWKCYVCTNCDSVGSNEPQDCKRLTTSEPITPSKEPTTTTEESITPSKEPTTTTKEPTTTTKEPTTTIEESTTTTEESTTTTEEIIVPPSDEIIALNSHNEDLESQPNVVMLLSPRFKRNFYYDSRAEEYGGCSKYTSSSGQVNRECVLKPEVNTFCNNREKCTVCTNESCNSSASIVASAILALAALAVLKILH